MRHGLPYKCGDRRLSTPKHWFFEIVNVGPTSFFKSFFSENSISVSAMTAIDEIVWKSVAFLVHCD